MSNTTFWVKQNEYRRFEVVRVTHQGSEWIATFRSKARAEKFRDEIDQEAREMAARNDARILNNLSGMKPQQLEAMNYD